MKFEEELEEQIITEWKEFYINYKLLSQIINPLHQIYKSEIHSENASGDNIKYKYQEKSDVTEQLLSIKEEDISNKNKSANFNLFLSIKKKFFTQLKIEVEKLDYFANEIYSNRHERRFNQIIEQLDYIKKNEEFIIFNDNLETCFKCFYRDISTFIKFIDLNIKIKQKILSKYIKYTSSFETLSDYKYILKFTNETLAKIEAQNLKLRNDAESKFSYYFHGKYNMHPIKILKTFLQNQIFTQKESFLLGISIGFMILLFLTCIVLGHNANLDIDEDPEFKSLFPMFRTFGILCLYLWTLGLNVWAWNYANINYRALFNFDNHYSTVIEICARSSLFSMVLFLGILLYILIRTQIPMFMFINKYISVKMIPLLCWSTMLVYFFCPFKIFNYQGRIYTMKLFVECIASIFIPIEFRHIWFMDQLTSLIGPMRDMEYTLCYYSYYNSPTPIRESFCNNTRTIYLIIGIFPNFIRCLQVGRQIIDNGKVSPYIYNIGKYTFNIIVATFSFLTNFSQNWFIPWCISAFISGCYSSFWDIVMDWGFYHWNNPNFPLREQLAYKTKLFYHATIILDIILRFLWVLSVSPEIMYNMIRPEFFALIIFTLEMFRRGLWNFIRVEYENLNLINQYQISFFEELPFIKELNGMFTINEHKLLNILNFEKQDKIKMQLREIFQSQEICSYENNSYYFNKDKRIDEEIAQRLEKYLKEYNKKTLKNNE